MTGILVHAALIDESADPLAKSILETIANDRRAAEPPPPPPVPTEPTAAALISEFLAQAAEHAHNSYLRDDERHFGSHRPPQRLSSIFANRTALMRAEIRGEPMSAIRPRFLVRAHESPAPEPRECTWRWSTWIERCGDTEPQRLTHFDPKEQDCIQEFYTSHSQIDPDDWPPLRRQRIEIGRVLLALQHICRHMEPNVVPVGSSLLYFEERLNTTDSASDPDFADDVREQDALRIASSPAIPSAFPGLKLRAFSSQYIPHTHFPAYYALRISRYSPQTSNPTASATISE